MVHQNSELVAQKAHFIFILFLVITTGPCTHGMNYTDDFYEFDDDNLPSLTPSLSPTSHPSPLLTNMPSTWFSNKPSLSCQVSSFGFYGDETIHDMRPEYVRYGYELEYKPNSDIEAILRDLEMAISNSIISSTSIFGECVQNQRMLLRSKSINRRESENIVGLSSSPKDMVTTVKCPHEKNHTDSSCRVIKGILTLYYQGQGKQSRRLEAVDEIIKTIKDGIGNGSLGQANQNILQLDYLDLNELVKAESGTGTSWGALNPLHFSYIALAVCGLLPFFAFIVTKAIQNRIRIHKEQMREFSASQFPIQVNSDDSTNFISSLGDTSEASYFKKWLHE